MSKELLGDENLELNPEAPRLPADITAVDIMAMEPKEMVNMQMLGEYDNIGLAFNKTTIGPYIQSYKSINRGLKMTVLHNSGTEAKYDKGLDTVKSFNSYHLSKGWKCIGYHWIISTEGIIYAGRKMEYLGSHAGSKGNPLSIGVCLVGNFEASDKPTEKQKEALAALHIALYKKFYGNSAVTIRFHKEFMSTGCPGKITVNEVMGWIKNDQEAPVDHKKPPVLVDGETTITGILINDSTYIKLRDLKKAGYIIEWDNNNNQALMNHPT